MNISEISAKLDTAIKSIEVSKAKVEATHSKRATVLAELDNICGIAAKEFGDAVAEAHKLRELMHTELAKIPALGTQMTGVIKGISK